MRPHWPAMTVLGASHARSLGSHEVTSAETPRISAVPVCSILSAGYGNDVERGLVCASRTHRLGREPWQRCSGVVAPLCAGLQPGDPHPQEPSPAAGRLSRTQNSEGGCRAGGPESQGSGGAATGWQEGRSPGRRRVGGGSSVPLLGQHHRPGALDLDNDPEFGHQSVRLGTVGYLHRNDHTGSAGADGNHHVPGWRDQHRGLCQQDRGGSGLQLCNRRPRGRIAHRHRCLRR